MIRTVSVAALIAMTATSSFAGSLNTEIPKVEDIDIVAAPSSSFNPVYLVPPVVCLLLCDEIFGDDDDDGASVADHPVVED